jgi:hypothetical protein
MNTVKPELSEIFEELEKNDVVDNSRGSRHPMAAWRSHLIHYGRIYTHFAGRRNNHSLSANNYGTQDRLKITSGPNTNLTGGLKWNK